LVAILLTAEMGDLTARGHAGESRPDTGFSIIEVVITLAILATVAVVGLTAVTTSVSSSARNRSHSQAETVAQNVIDLSTSVDYASVACATSAQWESVLAPAATSVGWPVSSVHVESVLYWQNTPPGFTNLCVAEVSPDATRKLQQINVTITNPTDGVMRNLQVVKSDV
jgi:prepilin-type N-terminal cleavage/methylation domain-containing protein